MKLLVGLGNPGAKYAANRHNIGWMAIDRIADAHAFGPWRTKFQGKVSEGRLGSDNVLLLKPDTFMNLSGQSVGEAMRFYKLAPQDIWVFHDELDLTPGRMKVKQGGGHAGHNGLRSLHQHIGDAYGRVRLGIGHPGHKDLVAHYVLSDFTKADQPWLDDLTQALSKSVPHLVNGDLARFSSEVSRLKTNVGTADPNKSNRMQKTQAPSTKKAKDPPSAIQHLIAKFR